jgi:hypothetical protein
MRVARLVVGIALALGLLAMIPSGAAAKAHHRHDRNHDRIPDRWEHRHHLSLHVKQTRRDQDHDGLKNLGEFRAHTNPHDADTDNDGIDDSDEHAGTIDTFNAQTDVLTINLFGGGTVSGKVTSDTEISCEGSDEGTVHASHEGEADNEGSDDQGDDEQGDDDQGDDNQGDDDQGEDDNGDENGSCSSADLQPGTVVHEAELEVTGAGAVFKDLELVK